LLPEQLDTFLSLLAMAENAAAQHFALIAQGLSAASHPEAARRYQDWACEEQGHYEQVCRTVGEFIPLSGDLLEVYGNVPGTVDAPLVERMAVAHFAHETAALAFLGHIHAHIQQHTQDAGRAKQLRHMCANLLCDEVTHVKDGKAFVAQFLQRQSQAVKTQVTSAVRLHRLFVIRTMRRVFGSSAFAGGMIARFDRCFRAATANVLEDPQ
jgi:hypothetical protein